MKYCSNCGTGLDQEAKFCPICGKAVNIAASNKKTKSDTNIRDALKKLVETKDCTSEFDQQDIENNKVFALLSYIGILFLIPIFAAPKSQYARYHANQGLILFVIGTVINMATGIITRVFDIFNIFAIISFTLIPVHIISIIPVILAIYGIYNAVTGKAKDLPIIGKIRIL